MNKKSKERSWFHIPRQIQLIGLVLFSFCLFYYLSTTILDPDFGWHLKMGEIIIHSGIPKTEPFAYTMPSYAFVDHEWLTNIALSLGFQTIGIQGLAIIVSFIASLTILFFVLAFDIQFVLFLFPVVSIFSLRMGGIRPQILGWLYFCILFFLLEKRKKMPRVLMFIPFLILVWVNTHGSFALGILTLTVVWIVSTLKDRRISKVFLGSLLFSFVATILNPYGIRIWHEIFQQLSDPLLHSRIQEWTPLLGRPELATASLIALSSFLLYTYWKKYDAEHLVVWCLVFALAFSAIRHAPYFAFLALFVIDRGWRTLENEVKKIKFGKERFFVFTTLLCGVLFLIAASDSFPMVLHAPSLSNAGFYPSQAILYLKMHPYSGNYFSYYGWGGYLNWQYSEKKVFIDGRMPSFRFAAPPTESKSAMDDYEAILGSNNPESYFEKYSITRILWPVPRNPTALDQWMERYGIANTQSSFLNTIPDRGWCLIYRDQTSLLYAKEGTDVFCLPK